MLKAKVEIGKISKGNLLELNTKAENEIIRAKKGNRNCGLKEKKL